MKYLICILIGYCLGCLNPAYFISKVKKIDIHKIGTGNPGATNSFMSLGTGWGCIVLIFDIAKAFMAVELSKWLFPTLVPAGVLAGCAAILGHIFPFYMKFRGGKGIASFGGMILALDWKLGILLLVAGCISMIIFNYGCSLSFSVAILFPFIYMGKVHNLIAFVSLILCSIVIIIRHRDNIKKIKDGEEVPVWTFLKTYIRHNRR